MPASPDEERNPIPPTFPPIAALIPAKVRFETLEAASDPWQPWQFEAYRAAPFGVWAETKCGRPKRMANASSNLLNSFIFKFPLLAAEKSPGQQAITAG